MNRQLLISQGEMLTSFDGRLIDNKQYKGVYDGETGKIFIKDNNKAIYAEIDNEDLAKILTKHGNNKNIEDKLKMLLSKTRKQKTRKQKTRKQKTRKQKTKKQKTKKTQTRSKKSHSKKTKSRSQTKRSATKSKKKSSKKKTIKQMLTPDFLKTII